MSDLQDAKGLVRGMHLALDSAGGDGFAAELQRHVTEDYLWRGMHPFHVLHGAGDVAREFWLPLRAAVTSLQRRPDVFFAGRNEIDGYGSVWVCQMGHFMGLFDAGWLGIPPTGKMCFVRFAEFNRVRDGKIAETALFIDILSVIQQAGLNPLPPQTGAAIIQPGPLTHDGLLYTPQDAEDGEVTLALINRMIGDINAHDRFATPTEELAHCWHDDMAWYGPAGIGATYTIDRYITQHQQPFRRHIKDRKFNGHLCRMAEGMYGGFFGWPNLTLTPTGNFLGLPAPGGPADMRVVDIYRRDGGKLAENWIFIDMLHFLNMQGMDVLARIAEVPRT